MEILILTTGGTIEGLEYDELDKAPATSPISIAEHLSHIDNTPEYQIKEVFSKDSRYISQNDRDSILREIEKTKADKILITHGTLTMVETAQYIGVKNSPKTIVLTGAFILGTSVKTDAVKNLHFALKSLGDLPSGTFIAIQNTIFQYDNVKKNTIENRFENITK